MLSSLKSVFFLLTAGLLLPVLLELFAHCNNFHTAVEKGSWTSTSLIVIIEVHLPPPHSWRRRELWSMEEEEDRLQGRHRRGWSPASSPYRSVEEFQKDHSWGWGTQMMVKHRAKFSNSTFEYRVSCTDGKISVRIICFYYLFFESSHSLVVFSFL